MSNCPICGHPPYSPPFRLCADCLAHLHESGTAQMPEGHNRQQESAPSGVVAPDLPVPRPRLCPLTATPKTTKPQSRAIPILAGDERRAATPFPRAMKNLLFTASQQPASQAQGNSFCIPVFVERTPAHDATTSPSRSANTGMQNELDCHDSLSAHDGCMPEGHERQQESVQNERTSVFLPVPRPRYQPEAKRPQTSSQRFLRRFGAGDSLATHDTPSRALKNPLFTASQFPPAYVPSPKVAAGVFSIRQAAPGFRFLRWVNLEGAVLVTPPLCAMGGTKLPKPLIIWTVLGQIQKRVFSPVSGGAHAD